MIRFWKYNNPLLLSYTFQEFKALCFDWIYVQCREMRELLKS